MFLVTGATGSLGRRIVRLLTQRDTPVRAFVRLSSNYRELELRGSQIFVGDLQIDKDINRAVDGVKYIISTHGYPGNPFAIDYRANIELIDRAKANQIEHFVYISVLGVDRENLNDPTFKAKKEVEKYLLRSGLNYTILRPAGFANNLLPLAERFRDTRGLYLLIGNPNNRLSIVSTDDLAKIAIDSVDIAGAKNQIFPVGGPDLLKREDIPGIFGRIFKLEPTIVNAPLFVLDALRAGSGIFDSQLQDGLGTVRTLLANEFFCTSEEIANLESVYGIEMESLESFLKRYLVKMN